jgi:FSR family fosmidomycin resistance protein-like MFS transporter
MKEAAWPLIRDDLSLSYFQIGLLLGIPAIVSSVLEPLIDILSDVWRRRLLILGGGAVYTAALTLCAASRGFIPLLAALVLFFPASGAFAGLSQSALMDLAPGRREQNMARWTFFGSVGVAAGPLALGFAAWIGIGWRGLFVACAFLSGCLLAAAWRGSPVGAPENAWSTKRPPSPPRGAALWNGLLDAVKAVRKPGVLRWLILLQFADLMLDVFYGFLALYFTDVIGISAADAALAVAVWTVSGLLGDLAIIPLLGKIRGLAYLRASSAVMTALFPAFLLVPSLPVKLVLLGAHGLLRAGWYSILKARLYSAMPGKSGTALALSSLASLPGSLIPLALGAIAQAAGLHTAIWLLFAGPLALAVGLPRENRKRE